MDFVRECPGRDGRILLHQSPYLSGRFGREDQEALVRVPSAHDDMTGVTKSPQMCGVLTEERLLTRGFGGVPLRSSLDLDCVQPQVSFGSRGWTCRLRSGVQRQDPGSEKAKRQSCGESESHGISR